MARLPRLDLAGIPQHVIQRGNNRNPCFFDTEDYVFYLECLNEAARTYACQVYAYVLMTNHVHLLVSSTERGGVSSLMQSLGRRYVRYINTRYQRTGTLWEGRFKSSLIDSERYFLACACYIALNPVRVGLVTDPAAYRWSSYHRYAYGRGDTWLAEHACYLALGPDPSARQVAYRALCAQAIPPQELEGIRRSVNRSGALGDESFQAAIEVALGRRVRPAKPGRPRKLLSSSKDC
jgi:putative transposase